MQATPCAQEVGHHAASLLTHLNLQREQGQFCDCVLRQKQNPDHIYPAHRCVLAASSPVLASLLPSAGALVELQDPHLSDFVLVFVLDYIYTGVLPCSLSQQQHYRLLSAACHLQMEELQEALRAARRQTVTEENSNGTEIHPDKGVHTTDLKTVSDLLLSPKYECFRRLEETETQHSPDDATFEEAQMNSVSFIKDKEKATDENDSNHPTRTGVSTLYGLNSVCELKSRSRVESKVVKQQKLMLNSSVLTEVRDIPGVNKEEHESQCPADAFVKLKIWLGSTKEELLETSKLKGRSSSWPHQCLGAVPVICHSSRAAVSLSPVSMAPAAHRDNTKDEEQNQDTRNKKNPAELKDSYNSSTTDQYITNSELLIQGLTPSLDPDHQHADSGSSQSDVSLVPQDREWSKGSKRRMDSDTDGVFFKHQRLDCYKCHNESLTTATDRQTKDWGSVVSLPEKDSDAGSDSHCGDGLAVEAKQEHVLSVRLLAKADTEESHCNTQGSETNWYPFGAVSIQHDYKSNSTSTSSESGLDDTFASECCTSREISRSKIIESCLTPMTPVENNMSDPTRETIGQPYRGHLRYQYFPHQDTLVEGFNYKPSQHSHSFNSDDSADEEEAGSSGMKQKTNQVLLLDINSKHQPDIEKKWILKRNKESSVSRDEGFIEPNEERNDETGKSSCKDQYKTEAPATRKAAEVSETTGWSVRPTSNLPDSEQTSVSPGLSSCVPGSLPASVLGERSAPSLQPFQCSLCDRSFSQRGSLNRHVRSHLGVRPFPCPCCPMTFSRQYRVTEHMRVHQRCTLGNVDSSRKVDEERPQN